MLCSLCMLLMLTMASPIHSANIPGRTHCPEGYILWPVDSTCHQGPCGDNQVLRDHQQGPYCDYIEDNNDNDNDNNDTETEEVKENVEYNPDKEVSAWSLGTVIDHPPGAVKVIHPQPSWSLPQPDSVPPSAGACLAKEQVWWPDDRQCYHLLSQGPCGAREWLVLDREDRVVCRHRVCPCDQDRPELCEVYVPDHPCQCIVSLAAAQDGVCDPGEQLLVTPYGDGVCGCIVDPPHTVWPQDGLCYPVHSRGPCDQGFILRISQDSQEPACLPALCGEGQVLYQDGECYQLGTMGPCPPLHILTLEQDTLEHGCVLNTSKVKRVYDIIPKNRGLVLDGPLSRNMKVGNCRLDSRGKCRKSFFVKEKRWGKNLSRDRNVKLYVKKRSPKKYLNWLKSFRKMKRN